MNVKNAKRCEGNKVKSISLKETNEHNESDIDDEDIALISRNSNKGMNYGKKISLTKENITKKDRKWML